MKRRKKATQSVDFLKLLQQEMQHLFQFPFYGRKIQFWLKISMDRSYYHEKIQTLDNTFC